MIDAEKLLSETSPIAVALMDAQVPCSTPDCPNPATHVGLSWDGPGPYWIVMAECFPCHKKNAKLDQEHWDRMGDRLA